MRQRLLLVGLLLSVATIAPPLLAADGPVIRYAEFDTTVTSVTVKRITHAIDEAERLGEDLVLVRIDTPGGLLNATEELVQDMLASEVPVVVWVGPSGAHAASAGFFILMAADVAAMSPGTRTGAASTITMGGGDNTTESVPLKKVNEDTAALIRSLAERRGRDSEAAEKTIFEAKAYEESVALEKNLVDLIAADRDDLLEQLDGFTVTRFNGDEVVLETEGAEIVVDDPGQLHRILEFFSMPEVVALLFMFGIAGLYFEFQNPGMIFPAVIGVVCLLLFAFASSILPISAFGVVLVIVAIVLFVLEVKVVSYGLLTAGGIACLIGGLMLLVDGPIPELRVPWTVYVPLSVTVAAVIVFALRFAVAAQRAPVATGIEGLAGVAGTVAKALDPVGTVFVRGELWNARSRGEAIPKGAAVRVVSVNELELTVKPDGNAGERSQL